MKLLIFSDSHGNVANMEDAVRLESPDRILHLGDLVRDAEALDAPLGLCPGRGRRVSAGGRGSPSPRTRA